MAKVIGEISNYLKIIKFNDYIYAISEPKVTYQANCFLIIQNKEGIMIDALTGLVPNLISTLEYLFKIKIRKLYLTHSHYDHFGGYDGRTIKYVYVHKDEARNLAKYYMSDKQVRDEIIDNGRTILPNLSNFSRYKVKKINNITFIKDGDTIHFGDLKLKVILTKGHTKGSLSFYEPLSKALFTGDTIYNGLIDLSEDVSDLNEFKESLTIINNYDIDYFLCGHYDPIVSSKDINIQKLINLMSKKSFKKNSIYDLGLLNISLKI